MKKTVFLFEHGVSNLPSRWREWCNLAIAHVHQKKWKSYHCAQTLFYITTPLTVWIKDKKRFSAFSKMLLGYVNKNFRIICAGHSNGARIILEGLKKAKWPRVEEIHLLCGACNADFDENGLNQALERN